MPSLQLTALRDTARTQKQIYSDHLKRVNRLRNDEFMPLSMKKKKMDELFAATRAQLTELQSEVKTNASAVKAKAVTKTVPTDIARADVRYMLGKQMSLHTIGQFAIEQKRPELLAALREVMPMLAAAYDLPDQGKTDPQRALSQAMSTVEQWERQVATPEEQAVYEEHSELTQSIGWIEDNFKNIDADLQGQERGSAPLLKELHCWPGLPGQGQYTGPISLTTEEVTH